MVGAEERGKGATVNLGPTINIDRDPRWGREFESYTEDPYLNAQTAVGYIDGVQSQGVQSQVKHYAVYNQETNRNTPADNAIVSEQALHEIYLPGFWASTNVAKAASVMCSYSTINGVPACQNQYLIKTTLDQRWAFPGYVTSDYQATHSTLQSADAGMDQEMPAPQYYGAALEAAVQAGEVSMATLNQMVSRILTEMFRFNDFNNPPTGTTSSTVTTPAHQAVSAEVAQDGTVLLKNSGGTLPLAADGGGNVAVIGPAASADPVDTGGGSAYVTSTFHVTPLQGIQAGGRAGHHGQLHPGPAYRHLADADPELRADPGLRTHRLRRDLHRDADRAGDRHLCALIREPCGCYTTVDLSLNGQELLANPGTPPVSTYSVGVNLVAGQTYTLQLSGGGESANLSWATPSQLAPGIASAVAAAKAAKTAVVVVSDDTETEAADRASLNLPSAQNELISAVAAANPHTVVVIDAGAPVVMPWISQVASVVDAWYPGESNGTALANVLFGNADPSGHLPVTFPVDLSQVPASTPGRVPRGERPGAVLRGHRRGLPVLRREERDPVVPVRVRAVVHPLLLQPPERHPGPGAERQLEPGSHQLRVQRAVEPAGDGVRHGDQHRQGGGLGRGPALPRRPGFRGAAAAAAPGVPEDHAAAGPVHHRALHPERPRAVLLGRRGERMGAAGRAVPGVRGRLLGLANLPLHGGFTVTRSVGARYATVSAPSVIAAGSTATVSETLVNGGDYAMPGARFTLGVPRGWAASPAGRRRLRGSRPDRDREVPGCRAGRRVAGQCHPQREGQLPARARQQRRGRRKLDDHGRAVFVLAASYDNIGISDNSDPAAANYDLAGDSYRPRRWPPGTPTPLTPGAR